MIYHTHQYFTQGTQKPNDAIRLLVDDYRLNVEETWSTYRLMGDNFSLRFTGREEFSITLRNQNEEFVPDKERLEFRVIGHFLHVAGTKKLVSAFNEPIAEVIFQALLDCYDDVQADSD